MFIFNRFEQLPMTEFVSIKEAAEIHKGDFKGSCIKATELKAGTGAKGDWTMKKFTLQDPSGQLEIACFNEEINFFKVGQFYEVENAWWKEFTDRNSNKQWSCNVGQYCKIKAINPPTTPTVKEATEIAKEASEIEPEPKGPDSVNGDNLPKLTPDKMEFANSQTIVLLQIEEEVIKTMQTYTPKLTLNPGKVSMFVKLIYWEQRKKED